MKFLEIAGDIKFFSSFDQPTALKKFLDLTQHVQLKLISFYFVFSCFPLLSQQYLGQFE